MLLQDLRYGLRLLMRRPAFAAVAVATLALGIGVTTTIFSIVDRVVLRAVPFPEPERLVVVWETNPELTTPMVVAPPTLSDWMERQRAFTELGAFQWRGVTFGGSDPERVSGAAVNASLLRLLGVTPALGRLFVDEEDRANARRVLLLSDALWRRRFAADPAILGKTVLADGVPFEIVGVMPPGYAAPPPVTFRGRPPSERAEFWMPLALDLAAGQRGAHYLTVIGRLRAGTTIESAGDDMARVAREVGDAHPDYRAWGTRVVSLGTWITESSRRAMQLLTAAVGFVLLLACANVANLLLARGVGRRREFAVRTALGAGRARLLRQVLTESLVLAGVGGVLGAGLAFAAIRLVATTGPANIPGLRDAAFDWRALGAAAGVSLLAAVLAGLAPAVSLARAQVKTWLTSRTGGGARGARTQQALVVGQIGLAVALLVTAALLVETFRHLRSLDPGFRPESVVTGRLALPAAAYADGASRSRFAAAVLQRVRAVAGVTAVGLADAVPLADNRQGTSFRPADADPADATRAPRANFAYVTDGFFEALGMRVVRGRTFAARDDGAAPRVVVINESLAAQMYGERDPIGRPATLGIAVATPFTIVGVVADDRHFGMDAQPTPSFFVPYRQLPAMRDVALLVRSSGEASSVTGAIRAAVREVDASLPLYQVRSMEDVVTTSMATPRALAWLLSSFAISGLLLAAIGVFGVLSHAVSQRTQEIGVRMAIGASPAAMLSMIVREGLAQVGLGLLLGLVLSWATSQLLAGLLVGVAATSPLPYLVVASILVVTAIAAMVSPARRAMNVDPAIALRAD